ncbi:MAG TPA: ATP-binding protein [Thermopetrobacter sp.]|nr:ATP-binding protein [Thermopetrobacter sp.]
MTRDANEQTSLLARIAAALERLAPPPRPATGMADAPGFVWEAAAERLKPVARINRLPLDLLIGVDMQRDALLANTRRFAAGLPANNALLWGARGMGKSSLVKAVHGALAADFAALKIVEIHRDDIASLPGLLDVLRNHPETRCVAFCDDLSFDSDDTSYKALKAVLEGGIEGRPDNVVFYATSNRRHLMPRDMIENERSSAIHPSETVQEKVSLSDRFGLWLGFHACSQDDYLAMIDAYAAHFGLGGDDERAALRHAALEWATTRGARSGRVAWQFIVDYAGAKGKRLPI